MSTLPRNAKLFTLFRVLFNCRFYYPVYFVMFMDFGLDMAEFAALNLLWAVAIVLLEVPSGAFADHLGRKRLVVAAAVFMVLEMLVLIITPPHSAMLFAMFAINRVLSGAAEAAASGADEALTYDSFPAGDREALWRRTMRHAMIWGSLGFVITSITGAAVYSNDFMSALLGTPLDKSQTLKIPLYLNLVTAIGALIVALRFEERRPPADDACMSAVRESFVGTLRAGRWILQSPAAFSLILIGLFFDSVIRVFYTVISNIYKLLQLPEATWGFVGATVSVIAIGAAFLCERMTARWTAGANFAFVTVLIFAGCISLFFAVPGWGIVLLLPMMMAMRFLGYFLSHYLNQVTPSDKRATVLSFRGVSMNLAFGTLTMLFGALSSHLDPSGGSDKLAAMAAFESALDWWLPFFTAGAISIFVFIRLRYRKGLTELVSDARLPDVTGQPGAPA